jgi:replicative DNA helicase
LTEGGIDGARSVAPGMRVPPHNLDAERSVLGGILLDNEQLDEVLAVLRADDFYREAHRKVFEAMVAIARKSEPVDRVTLKAQLEQMGRDVLDAVGGIGFIDLLDTVVPSASNLTYYARIVSQKAQLRRLIEAAHAIAVRAYEQHGDVAECVDDAEARIYAIHRDAAQHKLAGVRDELPAVLKELEARYQHPDHVTGLATGLDKLDRLTTGFQPGDLVVIAARPSMGKSALAGDVAREATLDGRGAAAIFSLEMPTRMCVERMLSAEARVNGQHMRTGRVTLDEWSRIGKAQMTLSARALFVNDSARTIFEIRSLARQCSSKLANTTTPLRVVIVDYLQLMQGTGEATDETREREIALFSRELKALAKALNVPVVALSQLNRRVEQRPDKHPVLSDLRESGAIEQDADLVLFIYRDEVYNRDSDAKGIAEIIVGKQRNGPIGTVEVAFLNDYTSFANLAPPESAQRSFEEASR